MYAMIGVGMLVATALLFAWAYGQFLRPHPKAWTRGDAGAITITLTIVCLFSFALAFLGSFLFDLDSETRWLEIAAVAAGGLLVCGLLIPRLIAPALRGTGTQTALGVSSMDRLPEPANDPHPTRPVRSGRAAGKPGRRRAA
jgi:predicted permease